MLHHKRLVVQSLVSDTLSKKRTSHHHTKADGASEWSASDSVFVPSAWVNNHIAYYAEPEQPHYALTMQYNGIKRNNGVDSGVSLLQYFLGRVTRCLFDSHCA